MNNNCHFVRPHSISEVTHCNPIPDCCEIINDCTCESNILLNQNNQISQKPVMISQNGYCETSPNQITYELEEKRIFNPNALYCCNNNFSRNNIDNNIFNNKLLFRTSSETHMDIPKQINPIQDNICNIICKRNSFCHATPNNFNRPIFICKNKPLTNYSNFMNNRRKRNCKYANYKNKLKNLSDISSSINNLLNRRKPYSSVNQSRKEDSKIDDESKNKNKLDCEEVVKIIIDKENKNKNLEDEINKCKENNNKLLNKLQNLKNAEKNYYLLNDENIKLKRDNEKLRNKLNTLEKDYKKILYINDESKNNFDNLLSKYDKLKEDFSILKNKYDELKEKYNILLKENKNLKIINDHNENELNDLNKKKDMNLRNADNMNNKINILKRDNNDLNKENQYLKNNNKSLLKKIEQLNKEIAYLNEKIKKYEKEKDEKSQYEDEIVIINKECTFSRGASGNFAFENSIKKDINDKDIFKYHEIIQELNNMILLYEHFFFKKGIKPKNNKELLSYLIVQYIDRKIKKIKLKTFFNLIMNIKDKQFKKNNSIRKNNYIKEEIDFNDKKGQLLRHHRFRKGYYNEK